MFHVWSATFVLIGERQRRQPKELDQIVWPDAVLERDSQHRPDPLRLRRPDVLIGGPKLDFDWRFVTHHDDVDRPTSAPFARGESGEIAVKVIDDRGNELLVVKELAEAE